MSHNVVTFNPYKTNSIADHQIGRKWVTEEGDVFRYAKAGASNITAGKLQLSPAPKTNHHNVAVAAAAAIGAKTVTVTLGATAAVANEYAGGFIVFSDVAPEGTRYRITGHPAAESAATLELTLQRPLVEAVTTSSEASLVHNTWNAVVEGTVTTRSAAGVPLVDVTAGEFCWLLTRGVTGVLADSAIDLGASVVAGSSTAGALDAQSDTAATAVDQVVVGKAIVAGVDTEYRPVELHID